MAMMLRYVSDICTQCLQPGASTTKKKGQPLPKKLQTTNPTKAQQIKVIFTEKKGNQKWPKSSENKRPSRSNRWCRHIQRPHLMVISPQDKRRTCIDLSLDHALYSSWHLCIARLSFVQWKLCRSNLQSRRHDMYALCVCDSWNGYSFRPMCHWNVHFILRDISALLVHLSSIILLISQ